MLGNKSAWLLGTGIVTFAGLYLWLNSEPAIPIRSQSAAPSPAQAESVPGGVQTPEYDRLQRTADAQRAEQAQQRGGSAMPTPPTLDELLSGKSSPVAAPVTADPLPQQPATATSRRTQRSAPTTNHRYAVALERQIKDLINYRDRRFAPNPTAMVVYQDAKALRAAQALAVQQAQTTPVVAPTTAPRDAHGELKPGDILHAILQTAINSDEPGPVRARVVGKRFNQAILLGRLDEFQPVVGNRPERVLVKFQYLTLPNGTVYDIESFAIDPDSTRTALASSVDHHYLSRWGALIAASFLEGYGSAVRASNRTTTVGLFGNVVSVPKDGINHDDIAKEALGTVGERLSNAVGQHFNRPNTIRVASGSALGVLIVSPVARPDSAPALSTQAPFGQGEPLVLRPRFHRSAVTITPPTR